MLGVAVIAGSLVVGTGKGGTGKTTIATHLGGLWALEGRRVLLVDLDVQGSATRRLGVDSDEGRGLFSAYALGEPLRAVEARPGLEVVAGGQLLREVVTLMTSAGVVEASARFEAAFAGLGSQYEAVIFDCPPASGVVTDVAIRASETLLAPSGVSRSDREGIEVLAAGLTPERRGEGLVVLGVVLFRVEPRRGRSRDDVAREELMARGVDVLEAQVRQAMGAVAMAEDRGLLLFELAALAEEHADASVGERISGEVPKFPSNVEAVAGDLLAVSYEVWDRMMRARELLAQRAGA